MLKKIAVDELVLGMHLHGFDAAWVDHPFWRTKFTLKNPADLAAIRASVVRECWIDVSKGSDVARPEAAAPAAIVAPPPPAAPALPQAAAFDDELRRATALCKRSREAVMQMFGEVRMGHALDTAACAELVEDVSAFKSHPARGHELLSEARGVAEEALDVVLHHHERIDGGGYPHGLAGDAISFIARMGAVCDVYDAVTSNRPYKAGWDPAEAIAHMASWRGHFDRAVFAAFVKTVGIHPTGSIVRLASGRLAVVVEQNAGAPTTPVVKVFYSTKANLRLPPERVDLVRSGDRIVGREPRGAWPSAQLDGLWAGDLLG